MGRRVSIMTLHAAKGLEFPAVFLPGWEDGLFPSQRSMDESGLKGLEEERRLAYVGITRAEEVCTISFAANRRVFGQWQNSMPSRFIDELPEDHVEVLTPPGLYGGGQPNRPGIETRAAEANVYNSPGWRRMQARQGQYGMSQPRESRNTVIDATARGQFHAGGTGVSPEIRLWRGDRDRGRQGRGRFRQGRHKESGLAFSDQQG